MRFRLEFDFPVFMLVTWKHEHNRPKNIWKQLGVFEANPGRRDKEGIVHRGIAKGQISCMITGFNCKQYSAYCFATGCDRDPISEGDDHFIPDPIVSTSHDVHGAEQNKDPREYFLDALVARSEQVRIEWETIVADLQRCRDESVSSSSPHAGSTQALKPQHLR
jgi:hypothetical protein